MPLDPREQATLSCKGKPFNASRQNVTLRQGSPLARIVSRLPLTIQQRKARIASLPKLHRDMANHMLWNGAPYKRISGALAQAGYSVTERNVSSWATGGYLEWQFEQDLVTQNRLDQ